MTIGRFFLFLALAVAPAVGIADTMAFGENYLSVEIVRNQPFSTSQTQFSAGDATAFAGFRHILADSWLMGVHIGYKQFEDKYSDQELNLFTALQESKYLLRLYDPVYFSIGPRLSFLLPTKGRKIPPEREKQFRREIGAALSADLIYNLNRRLLITLRFDRWRGVNTAIFQGTETAIGINYLLP